MKDIKKINNWEVLTPNGWSNFKAVSKLKKEVYITVKFTDGTYIKCSENHKLKLLSNEFIHVKDIKKGMKFIGKKYVLTVKSTRRINKNIELYDLNSVEKNKEFFANDVLSSNCAMIPDMSDMWAAIQPALSVGGKCHILSTPRNIGEWYHKTWVEANEGVVNGVGKNGFHPIRLPWDLHPDRNQQWRDAEGAKLGSVKEAAREYDCDFASSGDSVIELDIIKFYKETIKKDPIECRGVDRALWVWQYPDYTQTYIVSADTSRGDGGDFQTCHVINAITLEQCAEYKGQMSTKDFGNLLVSVATDYNNALLIIERENTGWAVIQQVIDREYPQLFYSTADLKYIDVQNQLSNKHYTDDKKAVPGFSTNVKTRPLVISHLEQYFREHAVQIYSSRTLSELETFIWKNGKAQAMDGYNDDLTMALGIGLWVRDTALRLRQEGIDLMKASLQHINKTKLDTTPVFKASANLKAQQNWQMSTGRQPNGTTNIEDISWLLG